MYNENHSHLDLDAMNKRYISDMKIGEQAIITSVVPISANDSIVRRLINLGFVEGEDVKLITFGPIGQDPLLVQIGFTRFALRASEASRVEVR
jgi:ferrous iron transport protein A